MEIRNERGYSLLEVKSVTEETRTITGMATTPETDRMGDVVDPMGAKFAKEIPLLWQHDAGSPVGIATFGKATKAGIPFSAQIAQIPDAGPLQQMVDMAWQAVKAKLVRGVSIGFRALEYSFMDNGGVNFMQTEIYELSLVTIPANAGATIQTIKAMSIKRDARTGILLVSRAAETPRTPSRGISLISR